jgi:hypothetical protein
MVQHNLAVRTDFSPHHVQASRLHRAKCTGNIGLPERGSGHHLGLESAAKAHVDVAARVRSGRGGHA